MHIKYWAKHLNIEYSINVGDPEWFLYLIFIIIWISVTYLTYATDNFHSGCFVIAHAKDVLGKANILWASTTNVELLEELLNNFLIVRILESGK